MGGPKGCLLFFFENIWETLLVIPESLFRPLKFSLWSSQNHCSVPSNSVYSPPQIIVLSPPNYKSLFPPKSLLCPLKFLHQSTKNIVLSPPNSKSLVPPKNHCFVPSKSKSLFCPLKSVLWSLQNHCSVPLKFRLWGPNTFYLILMFKTCF